LFCPDFSIRHQNDESRKAFIWAHSMLRSRMHVISVRDRDQQWQKAMVMVPVADLLNTGSDV
jgi:hypothetical protein